MKAAAESRAHDKKDTDTRDVSDGSDSDPLEEIIGPLPAKVSKVRSRGRGAFTVGSSLDQRFSSSYNPSLDIGRDDDMSDDWDEVLEAMRDGIQWQKQRADRFRSAGFTEEEIMKWDKGGKKNEEDVRWNKKGEGREWDRGKVINTSGEIVTEVEWGRLKGT